LSRALPLVARAMAEAGLRPLHATFQRRRHRASHQRAIVLVPLAAGLLLLCSTVLSTLATSITGSVSFIASSCRLAPPNLLGKSLPGRQARSIDGVDPEEIQYASFEGGQMTEVSTDDNFLDGDLQGFERFTDETSSTEAPPAADKSMSQVANGDEDGPVKTYVGVIKSFAQEKGYGFIKCQATFEEYKSDVFLHKNDARLLGKVSPGTPVRFAVQLNNNAKPQAREVSLYNTGDATPDKTASVAPEVVHDKDKVFVGRVKKYDATAGFGFLDCAETQRIFGRDVFLHKNQAAEAGNPRAGQFVKFCVEVSSKGQPQARKLTKFEPLLPQSTNPEATEESVPADLAA